MESVLFFPVTDVLLLLLLLLSRFSRVNSVRPHRRQPIRLPRPGDSPGKNTGVGCHFLLPNCFFYNVLGILQRFSV